MEQQKYNGWTNYATWRVNLEWVDDDAYWDWWEATTDDHPIREGKSKKMTKGDREHYAHALAEHIKEHCTQHIDDNSPDEFCHGITMAFLDDVNWYEIAWGIVDLWAESLETEAHE